MKNVRLLPVVVMAVAALLVLKTIGLMTNGAYVLTGTTTAQAAGATPAAVKEEGGEAGMTLTLPGEPTIADTSPTLSDTTPTVAGTPPPAAVAPAAAEHGAAPVVEAASAEHGAPSEPAPAELPLIPVRETTCIDVTTTLSDAPLVIDAASGGEGAAAPAPRPASPAGDCLPSGDAVPMQLDASGHTVPLVSADGSTMTEQQLLERLAARRTELETFEQNLALRASIVDAAEKRIEERAATLQALEAQIASLVDQRQEMESGQFAGIVTMYENMKPKDAANIFNNLDMNVLLRVAKTMSPRKMSPILAVMDAQRAQELTVKMAALADRPATEMTVDDLAALPQIVGQ